MSPLAVYVHIPFCVRKCAYCDFLSFPVDGRKGWEEEQQRYFHALIAEAEAAARELKEEYEVRSIFFGGGTPSLVREEGIRSVLESIRKDFTVSPDAEITLECNPGTTTAGKLKNLREAGVNRLSIGIQSFLDAELALLGRIHTGKDALTCYEDARTAGFSNINIDLMAALPGQTQKDLLENTMQAIRLAPEHISLYSLIIEPGTPFYERYAREVPDPHYDRTQSRKKDLQDHEAYGQSLPGEEEERGMLHAAWSMLENEGYERYEISNFSRSRTLRCVQNVTYWERGEYLGLGLGAASLIHETRFSNTRSLGAYLGAFGGDAPLSAIRENTEPLSVSERMEEFMFLGLRMAEGVGEKRFLEIFRTEIREVYGDVLDRCVRDGLIRRGGGRIFLTEKGTDLANYVMAQFLLS